MIIMLFGVSCVGKTSTGEKLAEKLNYRFIDLDNEIKCRFNTTIEQFINDYPYPYERSKIKGNILRDLIYEYKDNSVIAVSPIYYARSFNYLLDLKQVIGIELQDTAEHIFERLVFSDENDNVYKDDEYKEKHKKGYIKNIRSDITYTKRTFNKVKYKYFIDNRPIDLVVDDLMSMIQNI
jgi:shikimate kinase